MIRRLLPFYLVATSFALASGTPMNLARWQSGASLLTVNPSTGALETLSASQTGFSSSREACLLADDPSTGFRLEKGAFEMVVDLGMVHTLKEFGFLSFSADTECVVSGSVRRAGLSDPSWRGLGRASCLPGAAAKLSFAPVQARYVKLTFTSRSAGEISSLAINGVELASEARVQRPSRLSPEDAPGSPGMLPMDLASASQRGRLLGATGLAAGQDAAALFDQNPLTTCALSKDEPAVIMLDLGAECDLDTLAFSHTPAKGSFQFHFLPKELARGVTLEKTASGETMSIASFFFTSRKPDATVAAQAGDFRSRLTFAPKAARYVVARWVGAEAGTAPVLGGLSLIGQRHPSHVIPGMMVGSLASIQTPKGMVVSGDGLARIAPRSGAPAAVARPADVPVNDADFPSGE